MTRIGPRRLSNEEIVWLADAYQRIADARRIRWVNERDARQAGNLLAVTAVTIILFFLMWFV